MKLKFLLVPFLLTFAAASPLFAAPPITKAQAENLAASLKYQQGEIKLPGGIASIQLKNNFRYLSPADAETVLTKLWGNPPSGKQPLGMLVPAGFSPIDGETWAIVLSYDDDGHVQDDDAKKIDYAKMLKQIQSGESAENQERAKQGYPAVHLVGWAEPPTYDAASHKLYWAKQIHFSGDNSGDTLNYNIRILGRRGVLVLNAIAEMPQLAEVKKVTPEILSMVDFDKGNRYADFNPNTDKVAAYGIAALVAGGILAKAGFFKILIGALIAAKKFIIVGVLAAVAFFKKLIFGKGRNDPPTTR